jgi:hypothetical protein
MRPVLSCVLLVACGTPLSVARAPQARPEPPQPVQPTPATSPRPIQVLAGPRGTLLVLTDTSIEERDPTTGKTLVSVPSGPGTPVAVTRSNTRVYVLLALEQSHRLVELDDDLSTLATMTVAGEMTTFVPTVEPGTKGVRVVYMGPCPQDEEGCVVFETHRLSDLSVLAVRTGTYHAVFPQKKPPRPIPRDQGDADVAPGVPVPSLDSKLWGSNLP